MCSEFKEQQLADVGGGLNPREKTSGNALWISSDDAVSHKVDAETKITCFLFSSVC